MTATYPFGNLLKKQWWLWGARVFSYLVGTTGAAAKKSLLMFAITVKGESLHGLPMPT